MLHYGSHHRLQVTSQPPLDCESRSGLLPNVLLAPEICNCHDHDPVSCHKIFRPRIDLVFHVRNARAREDAELRDMVPDKVAVQSHEQGKQPAFVYRLKEVR